MLNQKWKNRIIDTEYINERAITATIVVNCQRIKLMSVYFSHSGYADHHIEKMYKTIEKHKRNCKNIHTDCRRRLQCRTGSWMRNRMYKVLADTLSTKETKEVIG